jgi:hypothetical protein
MGLTVWKLAHDEPPPKVRSELAEQSTPQAGVDGDDARGTLNEGLAPTRRVRTCRGSSDFAGLVRNVRSPYSKATSAFTARTHSSSA